MGVCTRCVNLEFRRCVVEWLLRTGECKRDNSARSHPGESGGDQLRQRRGRYESLSERLRCKHWHDGGQHQPGEYLEQSVFYFGPPFAALPACRSVQRLSSLV